MSRKRNSGLLRTSDVTRYTISNYWSVKKIIFARFLKRGSN